MMVLVAQLSFNSERYFCYLVSEEQSGRGPRGASVRTALSLAQFPVMEPSVFCSSQYTITGLRFHSLPHKVQVTQSVKGVHFEPLSGDLVSYNPPEINS